VEGIRVNRAVVGMTEELFKSIIRGVTPGAGVEFEHFSLLASEDEFSSQFAS